jgi:DNA-directed RNA polymerase specialized sigma24 family protein
MDAGRTNESPGGWLYRAAVRKGLDELRRLRRQEKYQPLLTLLGIAPSPEQMHATTQEQQNVRTVLAVLKRQEIAGILRDRQARTMVYRAASSVE